MILYSLSFKNNYKISRKVKSHEENSESELSKLRINHYRALD